MEWQQRWIRGMSQVSRRARGASASLLPSERSFETGLEVRPWFSLSLNEKDLRLLRDLQAFFACGWIRESKGDRTSRFEVGSID
jgi:hypothetical protein